MYKKTKHQFLQSLDYSLDPQILPVLMFPFHYGDESKTKADLGGVIRNN